MNCINGFKNINKLGQFSDTSKTAYGAGSIDLDGNFSCVWYWMDEVNRVFYAVWFTGSMQWKYFGNGIKANTISGFRHCDDDTE